MEWDRGRAVHTCMFICVHVHMRAHHIHAHHIHAQHTRRGRGWGSAQVVGGAGAVEAARTAVDRGDERGDGWGWWVGVAGMAMADGDGRW